MSAVEARPALLELRTVSRVHGAGPTAVHALRGVSVSVAAGELVAVMGPSGSGKSTLLHLAGGLDSPTGGTVAVEGVALGGLSRRELAAVRRRSVGYVFQELNLIPALTAAENVSLPRELDGVSPRAARLEALDALAEVDLEELAQRFLATCRAASSSGWRSPGRSWAPAGCCSPTSRRARSTPTPARRSCGSCARAATPAPVACS